MRRPASWSGYREVPLINYGLEAQKKEGDHDRRYHDSLRGSDKHDDRHRHRRPHEPHLCARVVLAM